MTTTAFAQEKPVQKPKIFCAIYTRKSTTEGLEQEFNSLDAQREACQKFIESQKGEGWRALPDLYDDGGFTGANTDRPAMQRLLADVRSGRIQCVVVYKVDRLSRSLLDFTRLIELFETHKVAFVSVTQQFNTNSSMGRLTLNVLLSFAQFEREIISERTRDKIAAARQKGRWIGGVPPLGYVVGEGKRLVVDQREKRLVREIFDLYLEHRSILWVATELNRRGHRSKTWKTKKGRELGGNVYRTALVQRILSNILYLGKVGHRDQIYPGEHEAIVSEEVFKAAQSIREGNRLHRSGPTLLGDPPLLKGILRCRSCGVAMIHAFTRKRKRLYRYYVCTTAQKRGWSACPTPSVSAPVLEAAVMENLLGILCKVETFREVGTALRQNWEALQPAQRIRSGRMVLERVEYAGKEGKLDLTLNPMGLQKLERELKGGRPDEEPAPAGTAF